MSKATKIWIIVASSLILLGVIVFGGAMVVNKWDFIKLSTSRYETERHGITEAYQNISIITDTADVVLVPSEDGKSEVVCYEQENIAHSVTVKDGTLTVELVDTRKWYEHIGISFGSPKITLCIPQGEYGALSVKESTGDVDIPGDFQFESVDISVSTGDVRSYASATEAIKISASTGYISLEGISAGSLELSTSTGKIAVTDVKCEGRVTVSVSTGRSCLTDITCQSLVSSGDTGDMSMKNVIVSEKLSVERSTGDVNFEACDAAEISVKTDTGDVRGSLITDKVFITRTDTGEVDVPNSITGGRCEISTDTGDIKITVN